MKLEYNLDVNDYLQLHLFNSSISERLKKKRKNSWFIFTISSLALGYILYNQDNLFLSYYFFFVGILFAFLYPTYSKWYYKRHYKKYVEETQKHNFEDISTIIFTDEAIETYEKDGSSKINLTVVEKIYEIDKYFFLRSKAEQTLLIPKYKIKDADSVRQELTKISKQINAEFISDLNWRWRF
jgi:hypothetical protein